MTETVPQKTRYHWLLWWKIDPDELAKQAKEYNSLGVASIRVISALMLVASAAVTIISIWAGWSEMSALVDVILFCGLAVFVYRGHRWAIICALILWTFEKGYQFYAAPQKGVVAVIWWTIYMQAFYMAYRVEKERRAAAVPLND